MHHCLLSMMVLVSPAASLKVPPTLIIPIKAWLQPLFLSRIVHVSCRYGGFILNFSDETNGYTIGMTRGTVLVE